MRKIYKKWVSNLLVVWIGCLPLGACANEHPKPPDRASYNVVIDAKGIPAVVGPDGRTIQAKKVTPPIAAKQITRVRTMSIIDVVGSHFVLIEIGGTLYRVDMPD